MPNPALSALLALVLSPVAMAASTPPAVPVEPAPVTAATLDVPPAAPVAAADAKSPAKPAQVCTREKPMGSNRTVRVCRDAAAAEQAGDRHREALQQAQRERFWPNEVR